MRFKGKDIGITRICCLVLYYGIAQYLPNSYSTFMGGPLWNWIRVRLCHGIFKKCGHITTINRKVHFDLGLNVEMGDGSGIGEGTRIPSDTIIGKYVILSRECFILSANHRFDRTDIPLCQQGMLPRERTVIEDDCWIGMRTILTPGRHVKTGTIVGMGSTLTKDFPPYSIVGGAPAKLIRIRTSQNKNV